MTRQAGTRSGLARISAAIADELGHDPQTVELIRRAAPLHDLGKIGIPDSILLKPDNLSPEERAVMQTHTIIGAKLLSGGRSELMKTAEIIALNHHERWDGEGYPNRIAGESIPIEARIVAVADYIDALTHNRSYRSARPLEGVLADIKEAAGRHFDPAVVSATLRGRVLAKIRPSPARSRPVAGIGTAFSKTT
jgi:putative two-component system response regulator